MRIILLVHRYLGIGVGLLMAMWCLSGFVMMYVSYPSLDSRARIARLAMIDWRHCCRVSKAIVADADPVPPFAIEMLAGRPVLGWRGRERSAGLIDLSTGDAIDHISPEDATSVAEAYESTVARAADVSPPPSRRGVAESPRLLGMVAFDQWTLEGISSRDRPLYHFDLRDRRRGQLYVSSATGWAIQLTTRRQRFWNWLGAVPHWLYFADLRHHARLWSQVVIYTALIGCFLTATGLYVGLRQLLRRPAGRWSPYRGFNFWHHLVGLLFGVFVLTWVFSGLLSMNPWGLMEGNGGAPEQARLRGSPSNGAQLRAALQGLAAAAPGGVVSVQSAALAGRLFTIADGADGSRHRLDINGVPARLSASDWRFIAAALHANPAEMQWLGRGDDYYFSSPREAVELPVWQSLARDGTDRRYYLDPISGALVAAIDRPAEHYRWWFEALHRMDFAAVIRARPLWDVLMWLLMSGVTAVCITGTYLGCRRIMR